MPWVHVTFFVCIKPATQSQVCRSKYSESACEICHSTHWQYWWCVAEMESDKWGTGSISSGWGGCESSLELWRIPTLCELQSDFTKWDSGRTHRATIFDKVLTAIIVTDISRVTVSSCCVHCFLEGDIVICAKPACVQLLPLHVIIPPSYILQILPDHLVNQSPYYLLYFGCQSSLWSILQILASSLAIRSTNQSDHLMNHYIIFHSICNEQTNQNSIIQHVAD